MSAFNRLTIVAAAKVISEFKSHSDMEVLEVQWGISGRCRDSSKSARVADLARIVADEPIDVMTTEGSVRIDRALVEVAISAAPYVNSSLAWKELIAGLRFDGYELVEDQAEGLEGRDWGRGQSGTTARLVRMLPSDLPGLDFREAESEVEHLLVLHGLSVARGHLRQAISAFSRGEWASANGALRNFYESYLNDIAVVLGYTGADDSKAKRDFLGGLQPPFLLADYNEWNANNQKPQFVQGLMSRMHPHGGHPGLSEEEDATFRLQITLITARLFLRRFSQWNAV
jgi:hypothetical protein